MTIRVPTMMQRHCLMTGVPQQPGFLDPTNNMPRQPNQRPWAGQEAPLSTQRVASCIPKGGTQGCWTYPSPQMFYNGEPVLCRQSLQARPARACRSRRLQSLSCAARGHCAVKGIMHVVHMSLMHSRLHDGQLELIWMCLAAT